MRKWERVEKPSNDISDACGDELESNDNGRRGTASQSSSPEVFVVGTENHRATLLHASPRRAARQATLT